MSNQGDRFAGGFLAGTIFGGIVGGLIGTLLANQLSSEEFDEDGELVENSPASLAKKQFQRIKQRVLNTSSEDLSIEEARQGLEDKISQLNDAIDQARQQLSKVNGSGASIED
jgi:gas vesicle protein